MKIFTPTLFKTVLQDILTCSVAVANVDKKLPLVEDSGHFPDRTDKKNASSLLDYSGLHQERHKQRESNIESFQKRKHNLWYV